MPQFDNNLLDYLSSMIPQSRLDQESDLSKTANVYRERPKTPNLAEEAMSFLQKVEQHSQAQRPRPFTRGLEGPRTIQDIGGGDEEDISQLRTDMRTNEQYTRGPNISPDGTFGGRPGFQATRVDEIDPSIRSAQSMPAHRETYKQELPRRPLPDLSNYAEAVGYRGAPVMPGMPQDPARYGPTNPGIQYTPENYDVITRSTGFHPADVPSSRPTPAPGAFIGGQMYGSDYVGPRVPTAGERRLGTNLDYMSENQPSPDPRPTPGGPYGPPQVRSQPMQGFGEPQVSSGIPPGYESPPYRAIPPPNVSQGPIPGMDITSLTQGPAIPPTTPPGPNPPPIPPIQMGTPPPTPGGGSPELLMSPAPPNMGIPQPTQDQIPDPRSMLGGPSTTANLSPEVQALLSGAQSPVAGGISPETRRTLENRGLRLPPQRDPNALPLPPPPIVDYGDSKNKAGTAETLAPVQARQAAGLPRNPPTDRTPLENREAPPLHQKMLGGVEPLESTAAEKTNPPLIVHDQNEALNRNETDNALDRITQGAGNTLTRPAGQALDAFGTILKMPIRALGHGIEAISSGLGLPDAVNKRALETGHANVSKILYQTRDTPGGISNASWQDIFGTNEQANKTIPGFGKIRPQDIPGGKFFFEDPGTDLAEYQGDISSIPLALGIPKYAYSQKGEEQRRNFAASKEGREAEENARQERAQTNQDVLTRANSKILDLQAKLAVEKNPIVIQQLNEELTRTRAQVANIRMDTRQGAVSLATGKEALRNWKTVHIDIPVATLQERARSTDVGALSYKYGVDASNYRSDQAAAAKEGVSEDKKRVNMIAYGATHAKDARSKYGEAANFVGKEPDIPWETQVQVARDKYGVDVTDSGELKWGYYPRPNKYGFTIALPNGGSLGIVGDNGDPDDALKKAAFNSQAFRWYRDLDPKNEITSPDQAKQVRQMFKKALAAQQQGQ